MILKLGDNV